LKYYVIYFIISFVYIFEEGFIADHWNIFIMGKN
jgi:hypothetical protein